jgi:hypothetical protein
LLRAKAKGNNRRGDDDGDDDDDEQDGAQQTDTRGVHRRYHSDCYRQTDKKPDPTRLPAPIVHTMLLKPSAMRSSLTKTTVLDVEKRDLQAEIATLQKELARKDGRIDALTRELQKLRVECANQQREQRIVAGTFEKINAEKTACAEELLRCKEQLYQVTRQGDTKSLVVHLGRHQQHIDDLTAQLERATADAADKDEQLKALQRENDVMQRTMDIHLRYDPPGSGSSSGGNSSGGGGNLRALTQELGRRQADAHSLALSLADKSAEADDLRRTLRDAVAVRDKLAADLDTRTDEWARLKDANAALTDALEAVNGKFAASRDAVAKSTAQIEDMSKRLAEVRATSDAAVKEKDSVAFELSSMLYSSQMECVALKGRVEELEQALAQQQSAAQLFEQRASANVETLAHERDALMTMLEQAGDLEAEVEALKGRVADADHDREELRYQLHEAEDAARREAGRERARTEEAEGRADDLRRQLHEAGDRERALANERAEALGTLERTIDAAKGLAAKLQEEAGRRAAAEERAADAERVVETLQRAKDHVSAAVLDALQQEKARVAHLEREVDALRRAGARDGSDSDSLRPPQYSAEPTVPRVSPPKPKPQPLPSPPPPPPATGTRSAVHDAATSPPSPSKQPLKPAAPASMPVPKPAAPSSSSAPAGAGRTPRLPDEAALSTPLVRGLARLREHLKEIEDNAPSLLEHSDVSYGVGGDHGGGGDGDGDRGYRYRDRYGDDGVGSDDSAESRLSSIGSLELDVDGHEQPAAGAAHRSIGASSSILLGLPSTLSPPSTASNTPPRNTTRGGGGTDSGGDVHMNALQVHLNSLEGSSVFVQPTATGTGSRATGKREKGVRFDLEPTAERGGARGGDRPRFRYGDDAVPDDVSLFDLAK